MTMDKSLRIRAGSTRSRNVLTRAERIEKLKEGDRYADGTTSPYGLPKVRVMKLSMKKKKKKKEEGEEGAAAAPAAGAAAKPAAGAAKPAAGAKPAAAAKPAAKK
jgi:small basic protein (TIGR04137 family)